MRGGSQRNFSYKVHARPRTAGWHSIACGRGKRVSSSLDFDIDARRSTHGWPSSTCPKRGCHQRHAVAYRRSRRDRGMRDNAQPHTLKSTCEAPLETIKRQHMRNSRIDARREKRATGWLVTPTCTSAQAPHGRENARRRKTALIQKGCEAPIRLVTFTSMHRSAGTRSAGEKSETKTNRGDSKGMRDINRIDDSRIECTAAPAPAAPEKGRETNLDRID